MPIVCPLKKHEIGTSLRGTLPPVRRVRTRSSLGDGERRRGASNSPRPATARVCLSKNNPGPLASKKIVRHQTLSELMMPTTGYAEHAAPSTETIDANDDGATPIHQRQSMFHRELDAFELRAKSVAE